MNSVSVEFTNDPLEFNFATFVEVFRESAKIYSLKDYKKYSGDVALYYLLMANYEAIDKSLPFEKDNITAIQSHFRKHDVTGNEKTDIAIWTLSLLIFWKIRAILILKMRLDLSHHIQHQKDMVNTVFVQEIIQRSILVWQGQKISGIIRMDRMNILCPLFIYNRSDVMGYRLEDLVEECDAQAEYDAEANKEYEEWMEMKNVGNEVIQEEDWGQLGK